MLVFTVIFNNNVLFFHCIFIFTKKKKILKTNKFSQGYFKNSSISAILYLIYFWHRVWRGSFLFWQQNSLLLFNKIFLLLLLFLLSRLPFQRIFEQMNRLFPNMTAHKCECKNEQWISITFQMLIITSRVCK